MDTCELVKMFRAGLAESHELFSRRIGCGLQTTTRWEKHRRPPTLLALARLAQVAQEAGYRELSREFDLAVHAALQEARNKYIGG